MNSRLDLLKKGAGSNKDKDTDKKPRAGMLDEETQKHKQHKHDELLDNDHDDDFDNETADSQSSEFDIDDDLNNDNSDENVNVIEINLDESQSIDIDPSLIDDDFNDEEKIKDTPEDESEASSEKDYNSFDNDIVEGKITVDYSEEDIKQELEYTFDHREQVYNIHLRIIKDGGMEIDTTKVLHLGDIIRISITLTELKEQVGCEARIVSVYPKNIRLSNNENSNTYRYIVQFIGPNASETERVLTKYLLGYKIK